jgi:hypothetical protein
MINKSAEAAEKEANGQWTLIKIDLDNRDLLPLVLSD